MTFRLPLGCAAAMAATLWVAGTAEAYFPLSVNVSTPPGGHSEITTPTLENGQKTLRTDISSPEVRFKRLVFTLARQPTPGKRFMVCILMHSNALKKRDFGHYNFTTGKVDFEADGPTGALVSLVACARIAQLIDQIIAEQGAASAAAAPKCLREPNEVPARLTRVGRRFRLTVSGAIKPSRRSSPLKVTCQRKTGKMILRVRPRSSRATLRSVVGPTLAVGVHNTDPTSSAAMKVTFRK